MAQSRLWLASTGAVPVLPPGAKLLKQPFWLVVLLIEHLEGDAMTYELLPPRELARPDYWLEKGLGSPRNSSKAPTLHKFSEFIAAYAAGVWGKVGRAYLEKGST